MENQTLSVIAKLLDSQCSWVLNWKESLCLLILSHLTISYSTTDVQREPAFTQGSYPGFWPIHLCGSETKYIQWPLHQKLVNETAPG